MLSAATVQGSDLTLAYAGILDTSGSPPASSFAVEVDGSARAVSSVSMSDSEVRLQLASAVSAGREVTVSYTPGERAIHHWHRDDGNEAAAVSHYSARNETRALPENARLSSLMLSGVDIGEFDSETTAYAGAVDHAVTATTVTVSANNGASVGIEPVDSEASAPGHQVALAVGANEIAVTVTAWDGETTRTYTVTVTRKPSTDARLSSLWLSGWSLTFDAEVTAYATWVPNEVTETTVAAEPSDPEAAVAIAPADADGEAPGHQVALSEGVNWIRATVTAEDGKATRTYTVAVTRGVPPAATFEADSVPTSHDGSAFVVRLRFSEDMAMGYAWVRDTLVQSVGGRVRRAQRVDPPLNAVWDLTVEPDAATADVTLTVSAGIDLPDGRTLAAGDAATVPVLRELSVADATSTEGGTAAFEVTLDRAAAAAVTVDYATSDGSAAAGSDYAAANGTLAFAAGEAAQTVLVSVLDDAVVEDEKTFVLTLTGASGNARLADATATGTIKDDDAATFRLAVAPAEIAEGGEARVRLTIEDGVTFAADRSVGLEVSGAVSASDYALEPGTLELAAGDGSVTAVLTALADGIAEASEAARIAALLDGAEVASAALTIRDASAEARLSALTLTDVEMDTFDAATTVYAATAAGWVTVTTVTAEPEDVSAAVEIADAAGSTLGTARTSRLARGANEIAATVTAEDGVTARTYAVTVARAGSAAWGTHRPERDIDLGGSGESTAVWSDGATLWALADWDGGAAQAYELATGARLRSRDLRLDDGFSQTALFSDGATLWAPSFYGGARAYALADGARLAERDLDESLSAAGNERPSGLWSDGSTWYVANLDDARLYAYAADGTRLESLEFGFRTGDVQGGWPWGLWSDGETLLTSWHGRGRVLAYRLADGARLPARDIDTGAVGNDDPRDVWSDGETLWVADGADRKLYAYAAPGLVRPAASGLLPVRVASRAHAVPSADPGARVDPGRGAQGPDSIGAGQAGGCGDRRERTGGAGGAGRAGRGDRGSDGPRACGEPRGHRPGPQPAHGSAPARRAGESRRPEPRRHRRRPVGGRGPGRARTAVAAGQRHRRRLGAGGPRQTARAGLGRQRHRRRDAARRTGIAAGARPRRQPGRGVVAAGAAGRDGRGALNVPVAGGAIDVGCRPALERKRADDHRGFGRDRHGARGACLLGYATRFCGTRPLWPLSGCRVVWNSLSIVGAVCRFFAGLVWASAGTAGACTRSCWRVGGRRPGELRSA